jgi:hypothetical protein
MTSISITIPTGFSGGGINNSVVPHQTTNFSINSVGLEIGPQVRELPSRLLAFGLSENEVNRRCQKLMDNKQISFDSPKSEQQAREILTIPLVPSAS